MKMQPVKLKSLVIRGHKIEFVRRKAGSFNPGQFQGEVYVQAYKDNRPFAAGKTKKEAIEGARRNLRIDKKWQSAKKKKMKYVILSRMPGKEKVYLYGSYEMKADAEAFAEKLRKKKPGVSVVIKKKLTTTYTI
jgi:hypothetical protein